MTSYHAMPCWRQSQWHASITLTYYHQSGRGFSFVESTAGTHLEVIWRISRKLYWTLTWLCLCYQVKAGQNFLPTCDDVIKWKHFPRYWPLVRGIHRAPVNSPHKGQWRGALMFSLICARINGWVNNREAGDLRCHRAHYDVIVMIWR